VLARLRHYRFIGGHHKHHKVKTVRTRKHVLDEALVTRNVNKAELKVPDDEIRKPDVDGYAALFFFFEAIGVDAGERFDQRGLAMVDVPGGSDDDVLHEKLL
jgi:hypothetical protein